MPLNTQFEPKVDKQLIKKMHSTDNIYVYVNNHLGICFCILLCQFVERTIETNRAKLFHIFK